MKIKHYLFTSTASVWTSPHTDLVTWTYCRSLPLTFPLQCQRIPDIPHWRRYFWAQRKTSSQWLAHSRPQQQWSNCSSWTWWRVPGNRHQTERYHQYWEERSLCNKNKEKNNLLLRCINMALIQPGWEKLRLTWLLLIWGGWSLNPQQ